MTDSDTQDAVSALAHRLRVRDAAIRDGEDYPDAEVFAADYLTALRGHGWRPTEARVLPAWKASPAGSAPLRPETMDLRRELAAEMEARAARDRAAKEGAA